MDEKQLQALANELAKNLKTPEDLSQFDRLLKKLILDPVLSAHLLQAQLRILFFFLCDMFCHIAFRIIAAGAGGSASN